MLRATYCQWWGSQNFTRFECYKDHISFVKFQCEIQPRDLYGRKLKSKNPTWNKFLQTIRLPTEIISYQMMSKWWFQKRNVPSKDSSNFDLVSVWFFSLDRNNLRRCFFADTGVLETWPGCLTWTGDSVLIETLKLKYWKILNFRIYLFCGENKIDLPPVAISSSELWSSEPEPKSSDWANSLLFGGEKRSNVDWLCCEEFIVASAWK